MQTNFHLTTNGHLPSAQSRYAYQCFPVRNNAKFSHGNDGAWLVEYETQKHQAFRKSLARTSISTKTAVELTGYYLVKQCYADEPDEICILNISGKNLSPVENEDFSLFSNVVHIDASDNNLPLETFRTFSNLEHLELQVNSVTSINVSHQDFIALKKLDLSYNSICDAALLALGKLRNVSELNLRGCGLKVLPPQLARGYQVSDNDSVEKKMKAENKTRYPQLTALDLSENNLTDISTFASLAGLRKLKTLNLSCNKISGVPHLRLMAAHRHFSLSTIAGSEVLNVPEHATTPENMAIEGSVVQHINQANDNTGKEDEDSIAEKSEDTTEQNFDEPKENVEQGEEDEEYETEDILEGIDETLSRISSNKDAEETNELLNMDFAQELNFSLNVPMTTARTVSEDGAGEHGNIRLQTSINDESGDNPFQNDSFFNTANELLDDDLKRPFPCLETIDLSYNQISREESLLALTSWPALQELKLWGNPLMRAYKGIPPVIHHHLKVMCGINIIRKEPRPQPKYQPIAPGLINSTKVRKVKDKIPPIKRNNLMAIEQMILHAIENKCSDHPEAKKEDTVKVDEADEENSEKGDAGLEMRKELDDDEANTFFLTQVNEEGVELETKQSSGDIDHENSINDVTCKEKEKEEEEEIDDIEELLKIEGDDDDNIVIPESMQGSVRALRHMLNNQLVFNRGHYNKHKKSIVYKTEKKQTRRDDINNALDVMRLSDHSSQENLAIVLGEMKQDPEIRKKFPEAKEMMKRVQEKYDHVRSNSLRPISETQQHLKQYSTRAEHPSQELVLSRMRKGRIGEFYSTSRGNTARVKIRGTRYDKVLQ